ncbi:hypothetical protein HETIRDRAFT_451671 [Heterobasidion irregulare TC 32-1]|uniref:Uncharacterized protein n=1 Tax=Heterobasidion irregulare (strain TC 32-1) TaxID=747525 RepID=W4KAB6_HETIT|nr:uncharacterized protein HETIRDRAFT_451671 [Heterobasidion irregulare TC 32-1]ETW82026.1 hypothetical protein HETIRDRAFT_451671 [Heterobasidion irregulare TC 32-1]
MAPAPRSLFPRRPSLPPRPFPSNAHLTSPPRTQNPALPPPHTRTHTHTLSPTLPPTRQQPPVLGPPRPLSLSAHCPPLAPPPPSKRPRPSPAAPYTAPIAAYDPKKDVIIFLRAHPFPPFPLLVSPPSALALSRLPVFSTLLSLARRLIHAA